MSLLRKTDIGKEFRKLARGLKVETDMQTLARFALAWLSVVQGTHEYRGYQGEQVKRKGKRNDVQFLETLYALQDKRQ